MARAKKETYRYIPLEERPEFIAAVAALPDDPVELERLAAQYQRTFHAAVLAGHVDVVKAQGDALSAVGVKLNAGVVRGSQGDGSALMAIIERNAPPLGQVPQWGQDGEFLLEVAGIRIRVRARSSSLSVTLHVDLNVVDLDELFVSETGYRSTYIWADRSLGLTVDQAVRQDVEMMLAAKGGKPRMVAPDAHIRGRWEGVPVWLADLLAGVRSDGQLLMGFAGADPVSPAKAPMSNADRQRAFRERQRKLKEEQGMQAVLLDEEERQLIYRLRELKRKADPIDDPRPFLLTQRDRTYLTGALDYYEFCTYGKWSQEYPKQNLRELYVRLSVHRQYAQETDFPAVEKRMAWEHEQITKSIWDGLKKQIAALEQEKNLLESERNKAHKAIGTWENRLRAAGQSTDYRPLPGEQGHVTVTNDKD